MNFFLRFSGLNCHVHALLNLFCKLWFTLDSKEARPHLVVSFCHSDHVWIQNTRIMVAKMLSWKFTTGPTNMAVVMSIIYKEYDSCKLFS